jgi:DNA polymerase-3 subunit epsilon
MNDPGSPSSRPPALGVPGSTRFSVIDLETTGLSPTEHAILQVAVVTTVGGSITDEWSSFVRLRHPFASLGPRHVHGIRRHQVAWAPPLRRVLADVARRIDGSVVVAHNTAFDWAFLSEAAARTGVELPPVDRLCTLRLSRALDPDRSRSHRLHAVATGYDIDNPRPHDALHDAHTTALVLPRLLADVIADGVAIDDFYERS